MERTNAPDEPFDVELLLKPITALEQTAAQVAEREDGEALSDALLAIGARLRDGTIAIQKRFLTNADSPKGATSSTHQQKQEQELEKLHATVRAKLRNLVLEFDRQARDCRGASHVSSTSGLERQRMSNEHMEAHKLILAQLWDLKQQRQPYGRYATTYLHHLWEFFAMRIPDDQHAELKEHERIVRGLAKEESGEEA